MRQTSLTPNKDEYLAVSDEHFQKFTLNLRKKLQIAFSNSSEAMGFFDLTGTETLRIDEFLFGVQFFFSGSKLKECLMLFQQLDKNKDGLLDEIEFDALFISLDQKKIDLASIDNEIDMNYYLQGGYNTYNKRPWQMNDLLDLPHFQSQRMNKMTMMKRGKEVGREQTPQLGPKPIKATRKLVVLPAKPPPRKAQSVMRTISDDMQKETAKTTRGLQRKAESGVYDELNRLEQVNHALNGT